MPVVFTLLVLSFIGTLGARQPDIDINRIKLLPKEDLRFRTPTFHRRRSIITNQHNRRNDYGYHSGRVTKLRAPVHLLHDTTSTAAPQTGKIHQPKEDPRIYYQSDAYIKEINRKNINNEVSSIYLGRGEVQASADNYRPVPIRFAENKFNSIDEELCVQCPHDRILVAKAGFDHALLQHPHLMTCDGRKAPRDTHFEHLYGPKFGSLIKEGSHMVVGFITHNGDILQSCKMQIQMLMQTCSVPKYLISHCTDQNKTCSFTCRSPMAEIRGRKILTCGEDMKWSGQLPVCSVHSWCAPPPPPEHGKVACQGKTLTDGRTLAEGTRCRVKCEPGWRSSPRPHVVSICRRGNWTHELSCQPKITYNNKS